MTEKDQMQELLERLIEKTERKEITWSDSVPPGSFMTSFPRHSVKIGPGSEFLAFVNRASAEDLFLTLAIYNDTGTVVAATPTTLADSLAHPERSVPKEQLAQLYRIVRASKTRNTEIDELLQELRH
jgi:hypothetical protein